MEMSTNTIAFRYDASNEVVIARPDGKGPVDVIFVLDDFAVEPAVLTVWGKYRADMVKTFTRHSYRVNASRRVSTFSHTSGALYNAASDEAPDIETALIRLRELRERARCG
jgi:hypothetical protein